MNQIIFLDTNVILDYIENRNQEVRDIIAQLLLFHENDKIVLATSVFNISELIDKEFEIHYIGNLLSEKLSYDEILKQKSNKKQFRGVAMKNKGKIEKKIKNFIFGKKIEILTLLISNIENGNTEINEKENKSYEELYDLIYNYQFSSQDALIIASALSNKVTYFLSNDGDIINQINNNNLMYAFNLRDQGDRKHFKNNFLDTLADTLI